MNTHRLDVRCCVVENEAGYVTSVNRFGTSALLLGAVGPCQKSLFEDLS